MFNSMTSNSTTIHGRMKLAVGKTYLDRHGNKITILRHDTDNPLPYLGDDKCGYQSDGRFSYIRKSSEWDLIEEVQDQLT